MSFPNPKVYRAVLLPLLLGAGLVAGCAKKPVATTQPPPAPPQAQTPVPPAPPSTPTESAPTESGDGGVRAEDFQAAFFDYDSYTLREDARQALDRNAKLLRDHPLVTVTIEGHCDERGTAEYNQALGERRAAAARDYLVAAGVAIGRIDMISYGKERPFATGQDEASWQQNRRAHFAIRRAS